MLKRSLIILIFFIIACQPPRPKGTYHNGSKKGQWTYFHENGQMEKEGFYHKGRKIGMWTYYYDDGKKKQKGYFRSGKKVGEWTSFHKNGKKKQKGVLKAGKRSGKWTFWYKIGLKSKQGPFQILGGKSVQHGDWTYWETSGNIQKKGLFFNGRKEGIWTFYENGKIKKKVRYHRGQIRPNQRALSRENRQLSARK